MGRHPVTLSHPEFLAVAPLVMLLVSLALLAQRRRLRRLADAYGDTAIGRLVPVDVRRFPTARLACLLIAGLAICLAAAGPGVTTNRGARAAAPLDIAIVVDVSVSMGATDIEPTRIQRARDVIVRLSKEVPGARFSLFLSGDWTYTLVPPTDDPHVVEYFAGSLTATLVSSLASSIRAASGDHGASLQAAIAHARAALDARPAADATKMILVISDGAIPGNADEVVSAVPAAAGKGAVVWTAGIGTTKGATFAGGSDVIAGFGEPLLRAVAKAGGGVYEDVSQERGVRSLVSGLRRLVGVATPEDVIPERIAFWLLLLAILVLLCEGGLDVGKRLLPGASKEDVA
jgi:Ca-activated chloride channel family protein